MDEQTTALLAQLKDIHIPVDPHWWPPAPGWWLLAVLLFGFVFYLFSLVASIRCRAKMKQRAMAELDHIAQQAESQPASWGHHQLALLMKRVAREAFPDNHIAAFDQRQWKEFLSSTPVKSDRFDSDLITQSQQAAYQANPKQLSHSTIEACRAWIQIHYPARQTVRAV